MSEDLSVMLVFVIVFVIMCGLVYIGYKEGYSSGIEFTEKLNQKYLECESMSLNREQCDKLIGDKK